MSDTKHSPTPWKVPEKFRREGEIEIADATGAYPINYEGWGEEGHECSSADQRFSVSRSSVLIPTTCVSTPSKLAIPAWYAVISFVQPPVKAAGKNASTTVLLPRKSASETCPPLVEGSLKSGAMSPTFKCVFAGPWPKAAAPPAAALSIRNCTLVMSCPFRSCDSRVLG